MKYMLFSANFFLGMVETVFFYKVMFRRKLCMPKWYQIFLLAGIFVCYLLGRVFTWNTLMIDVILMIGDFLAGVLFTGIEIIENLKYWIVKFFSTVALEGAIRQGLSFALPSIKDNGDLQVILVMLCMITMLFLLSRLSFFKEMEPLRLSGRNAVILSVSFGSIAVFLSSMGIIINEYAEGKVQTAATLLLSFAEFGSCMAIILFLYIFQQRDYFKRQAVLENEYNKQQSAYFHMLLERERETRKFRHDMTSHMLCLQEMARKEDVAGVQKYLAENLYVLNKIGKKEYSVGNETIDILLNHYFAPIKKSCHIEVEGVFGRAEHISRMELCTIFSNVFKNAVEAVSTISPESSVEKSILIHASHGERFMKLTIQNTCAEGINVENEKIKTKKLDVKNHGFGIENAYAAVERCGGSFDYEVTQDCFSVQIILPIRPLV